MRHPPRAAAAALFLLLPQVAAADATPATPPPPPVLWGFKVVDVNPPARVFAEQAATALDAERLYTLTRPTLGAPNLPDPLTYQWNTWQQTAVTSAHVRLTDLATGQAAWRTVSYSAYREWALNDARTGWAFTREGTMAWRGAADPFEPYLGGNTYRLWVDDNGGINVTVLADTAPTHLDPEPATLVLAGLGLGAVALRRRGRRVPG